MAEWRDKMGFPGTGFSFLGLQRVKSLYSHLVIYWKLILDQGQKQHLFKTTWLAAFVLTSILCILLLPALNILGKVSFLKIVHYCF